MPTRLYFSNDIESLARAFIHEMAGRHDWFTPCSVIVPNPYLQKWLQLRIAEQLGIAMNIDFRFLNDGLWKMVDAVNPEPEKPSMLVPLDLQLMIRHVLASSDNDARLIQPIAEYLHGPDGTPHEHKNWQLSLRLSRYFLEYELYREEMVTTWMQGKLLYNTAMEAAQQHLYRTIFMPGGCRDILSCTLLTLPQYWAHVSSVSPAPVSGTLYLFGKSQLSPFHARMLYELGKRTDISIYQVNPCSEFWEDVTTPREDRWNRIRSIRIEESPEGDSLSYDANENPLLKLWGKTGRETTKMLSLLEDAGSADMSFTSEWFEPERHSPPRTCLGVVREQILRRTTRTPSGERLHQDTSIQVASCPEIVRESETVYNSIINNLENDPRLAMTDIAIMVPDMATYGPVLHSVFSREPRRLSYSMIDSSASTDSLFAKGMESILKIAAGQFTRTEIFGLVYNRCFLAAHDMDTHDADTWLSWADALHIFHRFTRNNDADPRSNPYTWKQALQRIRFGRIMNPYEADSESGIFLDYRHIVPYADMQSADDRCIDAFNRVIELLHEKTRRLSSTTATGTEWARIIDGLASDFLAIPDDRRKEDAVLHKLRADMRRLAEADLLSGTGNSPLYSLAFITEFIRHALGTIPSIHGSYLTSGVNISALVPKRQVPFKIIYLMGMQEGIFPGVVDSSSLNLMHHARMIGDISRPDANRYLFLETLLSARDKIYITYVNRDLQKDKAFYPNSVVGQLMTYVTNHVIDAHFTISQVPPSGSSDRYLTPGSAIPPVADVIVSSAGNCYRPVNYSESELLLLYKNAAHAARNTEQVISFVNQKIAEKTPDFTIPLSRGMKEQVSRSVYLQDLANFLINPIESALQWHLGIYPEKDEDRSVLEDEPFFSTYPHDYRFIIDALNYYIRSDFAQDIDAYIHAYYEHAFLKSITPTGAYREIDYDNYYAIIKERIEAANGLAEFISERGSFAFYQNVTFGLNRRNAKADLAFPPFQFDIPAGSLGTSIELGGSIPFLWKDPDTGMCDSLIVTNSGKPSIVHILQPFLFYIAAVSGYNEKLADLAGTAPYTIYVSHKSGITAYRYHISKEDAVIYLHRLMDGFFSESSFDLLPLAIIADPRSGLPCEMKNLPDESEMKHFRDLLIRLIDDQADKEMPVYRPMKILQVIDAEVPADAYVKVRDRLMILLLPFLQRGSGA